MLCSSRQVCARQITTDTQDDLSLVLSGDTLPANSSQKNWRHQKHHTGSITSWFLMVTFKRHFNTENRKAFVVGLFKPRTSGEEREKRLVSWFRLSEEFSVLHMPHLLLANSVQLGFLLSMPVTRHFEAIFIRFP